MHVVVTGGATSLGLVIARRFEAAGDRVYVLDVSESAVASLAGEPSIRAVTVDVLDPAAVQRAFSTIIAESGSIDVLVNNVGLPGPRTPVEEVSIDDWNRTLAGSVGAAFYCVRAVVPAMKRRRSGAIVNISTCSVKTGIPNRAPYVTAKGALEAFSANCARELGPFNIRVNAVRPGAIDNERLQRILKGVAQERGISPEAAEAELLSHVSMRTKIALSEVADMVHFLGSSQAPHITGQCIAVDGNVEWEA